MPAKKLDSLIKISSRLKTVRFKMTLLLWPKRTGNQLSKCVISICYGFAIKKILIYSKLMPLDINSIMASDLYPLSSTSSISTSIYNNIIHKKFIALSFHPITLFLSTALISSFFNIVSSMIFRPMCTIFFAIVFREYFLYEALFKEGKNKLFRLFIYSSCY